MNYHDITKEDMLNGDGIRVVLWVAGCNHYCKNCQNPITWDADGGLLFDETAENELFVRISLKTDDSFCFNHQCAHCRTTIVVPSSKRKRSKPGDSRVPMRNSLLCRDNDFDKWQYKNFI